MMEHKSLPGPLLELLRDQTTFRFRTDPSPDDPRLSTVDTLLVPASEWWGRPESHDNRWGAKELPLGLVLAVRLVV